MTAPAILSNVVITSSNKWIDVHTSIGGEADFSASITEGTYGSIRDVASALQTAIRALNGGAPFGAATVSVVFTGAVPGMVAIYGGYTEGGTFSIEWSTGAHAGSTVGPLLGFTVSADDTGGFTYTSDYQHQYGWYALRAPESYGPVVPEAIGGEIRIPLAGTSAKIVHIGYQHTFRVALAEIPYYIMLDEYATSANTNRALETVWEMGIQGYQLAWHEDQQSATHTHMYLTSPRSWTSALTRPHADLHSYNIAMEMRKVEA